MKLTSAAHDGMIERPEERALLSGRPSGEVERSQLMARVVRAALVRRAGGLYLARYEDHHDDLF